MSFDPEELGLPPDEEGVSEPVDLSGLVALAAQGAAFAAAQAQRPAAAARPAAPQRRPQQAPPPAPRVPTAFDEIDQRLSLSGYYRALLEQPFFEEGDEYADIVEQEVRQFVLSRLGDLLGTSRPKPPVEVKLPFTENEVKALRAFAVVLMTKQPSIIRAAPPAPPAPPAENEPPPDPPRPAAPKTPKVRQARRPAPAEEPQPEAPPPPPAPVLPPMPRRRPAPRAPARPVAAAPDAQEPAPEEEQAGPAPSAEAPIRPVPMPTGTAYTAVTANSALQTVAALDREIERQLKR